MLRKVFRDACCRLRRLLQLVVRGGALLINRVALAPRVCALFLAPLEAISTMAASDERVSEWAALLPIYIDTQFVHLWNATTLFSLLRTSKQTFFISSNKSRERRRRRRCRQGGKKSALQRGWQEKQLWRSARKIDCTVFWNINRVCETFNLLPSFIAWERSRYCLNLPSLSRCRREHPFNKLSLLE